MSVQRQRVMEYRSRQREMLADLLLELFVGFAVAFVPIAGLAFALWAVLT